MAKPKGTTHNSSKLFETFLSYRAQIARSIAGIVRTDDIDDIVQETFVKSYEAQMKQEIQYERTYMLATARNLALNHVTRAAERMNDSLEDIDSKANGLRTQDLEKQVESKERFIHFCRATDKLSAEVKRVFLLKKVYGLSQREIAETLGLSESTVEKHVAKGLMLCARYMQNVAMESAKREAAAPVHPSLKLRRSK